MSANPSPLSVVSSVISVPRNRRLIKAVLDATRDIEASGASPLTARRRQVLKIKKILVQEMCLTRFNKKGPDECYHKHYKEVGVSEIRTDVVKDIVSYHYFLHEVSHFLLHVNYNKDKVSYNEFRRERFLMEGQADSLANIIKLKNNKACDTSKYHAWALSERSKVVKESKYLEVYKLFWVDIEEHLKKAFAR